MIAIELALAGVAVGAVAALAGLGVLVTYRTTGVFNLASGGMAMVVAYVLWQAVRVWHWPLWLAAFLALFVVGPGLGLAAEWLIFRPLRRRSASTAETLVASTGLLVLLLGIASQIWSLQARQDAPSLVPSGAVDLPGGATIDRSSLAQLLIAVVVGLALTVVSRRTRAGLLARAVVDQRSLALLSGVNADRVAATGWALGGALAGIAGVLLAPSTQLSPYGLTLVVLETLAVVVIAKLVSAVAVVGSALAIGIAQSELQQVQLHGVAQTIFGSVQSNLFVLALLIGLLLIPQLAETGSGAVSALARRPVRWPRWTVPIGVLVLGSPLLFPVVSLRTAQQVPGLALIFLSLMLLSGVAGQISLGAAGYAGVGALLSAGFMDGAAGLPRLPGPVALAFGAIGAGVLGLITGYPALRRSGLALALTTLAVGTVASRFVFEQPNFTSGLQIRQVVGGAAPSMPSSWCACCWGSVWSSCSRTGRLDARFALPVTAPTVPAPRGSTCGPSRSRRSPSARRWPGSAGGCSSNLPVLSTPALSIPCMACCGSPPSSWPGPTAQSRLWSRQRSRCSSIPLPSPGLRCSSSACWRHCSAASHVASRASSTRPRGRYRSRRGCRAPN